MRKLVFHVFSPQFRAISYHISLGLQMQKAATPGRTIDYVSQRSTSILGKNTFIFSGANFIMNFLYRYQMPKMYKRSLAQQRTSFQLLRIIYFLYFYNPQKYIFQLFQPIRNVTFLASWERSFSLAFLKKPFRICNFLPSYEIFDTFNIYFCMQGPFGYQSLS